MRPLTRIAAMAAILVPALLVLALTACTSVKSPGDIHFENGLNLFVEGEFESAVSEFEKAVETGVTKYKPEEAYMALGNTYLELGRCDEAIEMQTRALEIDGDSVSAWVNLGAAYRLRGDLDEAEECYSKALDIDPEYAQLRSSLGTLYLIKNEPEKAIEEFERSIELKPDLEVAYGNAALAYAMTGDFDKAYEYLERSIKLGYRNAEVIREGIEAFRE
jgi:Flp pilus assembly protein TadD